LLFMLFTRLKTVTQINSSPEQNILDFCIMEREKSAKQ
jgi:hypothetical protein